ncbi:MAG: lysylphosphatidylglycerol synthase transmembrane domain-containing protein [Lentisphaeria bacterium]
MFFGAIVFAASIWYIGRTFQWRELGQVLKNVNLACLIAGGGASIVTYWLLRTLRWHILLRRTCTHVPFLDLYLCTAVSLSFSLVTPFQSGEMLKIELLKKYGLIQRSPGYGTFLIERVLDLAALLTMACVSLLTTVNILPNRAYAILGGLLLAGVAGLLVLAKLRVTGRLQRLLEHMRQCVGDLPTLILAVVITGVSWASVVFSWQVFLYAGGIHLDFAKAVALMSIVALISIISLIPGGVGIGEVGTSQLLMHFGCAAAIAQRGSLVLRAYSLVTIALGACHLGLWELVRCRRNQCDCQGARGKS